MQAPAKNATKTKHKNFRTMAKKSNHRSDIKNPNKGTKGTNKTWDKAQGNRGKLMNPNWYKDRPQHQPKKSGK